MRTFASTVVNAFRRPTSATEVLTQPIMLVAASIGLCTLMFQEVFPAFAEAGYGPDYQIVMTLFLSLIGGLVLLIALISPSAWRAVSEHQRLNDEAGFNLVGARERDRMVRFEAALQRLKARRQRLRSGQS